MWKYHSKLLFFSQLALVWPQDTREKNGVQTLREDSWKAKTVGVESCELTVTALLLFVCMYNVYSVTSHKAFYLQCAFFACICMYCFCQSPLYGDPCCASTMISLKMNKEALAFRLVPVWPPKPVGIMQYFCNGYSCDNLMLLLIHLRKKKKKKTQLCWNCEQFRSWNVIKSIQLPCAVLVLVAVTDFACKACQHYVWSQLIQPSSLEQLNAAALLIC